MVTLKDLSRRLGLSVPQISRALGGYSDVSDATRKRVADAARELGYRPNPNALRLKTGKSGIVGLVVPEASEQEESNILVEILLGLAVEFWQRDILVVLNVMPRAGTTVESYQRLANEGQLDGFVVLNPSFDPAGAEYLLEQRVPFVTHGRSVANPNHPFVDLDNFAVGERMASRLVALGHRDIALIDGPVESFSAMERLNGIVGATGVPPQDDLVCRGIMTEHFGEMSARTLMTRPHPPTAIIVGNMVLAAGVLRGFNDLGLSVPAEVSILVHDDVLARYPRSIFPLDLGGTRSPFSQAWTAIADILVRAIDGEEVSTLRALLSPTFVEGRSAAPL